MPFTWTMIPQVALNSFADYATTAALNSVATQIGNDIITAQGAEEVINQAIQDSITATASQLTAIADANYQALSGLISDKLDVSTYNNFVNTEFNDTQLLVNSIHNTYVPADEFSAVSSNLENMISTGLNTKVNTSELGAIETRLTDVETIATAIDLDVQGHTTALNQAAVQFAALEADSAQLVVAVENLGDRVEELQTALAA